MRVPVTPPKPAKYINLPSSRATAVGCTTHMGDTPWHHRGATGKTPLALARRNSGRTGLKQHKCFNCNTLRNQPESVSQCLHLLRANKEKQRRPQRDAFVISATDCRRLSAGQYRH